MKVMVEDWTLLVQICTTSFGISYAVFGWLTFAVQWWVGNNEPTERRRQMGALYGALIVPLFISYLIFLCGGVGEGFNFESCKWYLISLGVYLLIHKIALEILRSYRKRLSGLPDPHSIRKSWTLD